MMHEIKTCRRTESIFNKIIESVAITIVGESVVGRRKLLQALRGNGGEVPRKLSVLSKNHGASSHKAIDQRLLPHLQKLQNKF